MLIDQYIKLKNNWLDKRIPVANEYEFNLRNTFILPSRFGWVFLTVGVFLFVLGTNYQNNLVLMLSFILFSIMLLSLFHSYYFFTRIQCTFMKQDELFANQTAYLNVRFESKNSIDEVSLFYHLEERTHDLTRSQPLQNKQSIIRKLPISKSSVHQIILGPVRRGLHKIPRITFFSTYPFGLYKTWTHLAVKQSLIIFPEPTSSVYKPILSSSNKKGNGGTVMELSSSEELQGVRKYRDEDPIYHVSWKHLAKGQGMQSKEFAVQRNVITELDIKKTQGTSTEEKLSTLCGAVLALSNSGQKFGLRLGGQYVIPNEGNHHRLQCLEHLAKYSPVNDGTRYD